MPLAIVWMVFIIIPAIPGVGIYCIYKWIMTGNAVNFASIYHKVLSVGEIPIERIWLMLFGKDECAKINKDIGFVTDDPFEAGLKWGQKHPDKDTVARILKTYTDDNVSDKEIDDVFHSL